MRDPLGRVEITADAVLRHAYVPLAADHFLDSGAAHELVARELLVAFEFVSRSVLRTTRIPFVSHPWEWTHEQLLEAATTTLEVAQAALATGYELKDASAFNIIFGGRRAHFCDHFSFQPVVHKQWWAYGQFARHFLYPLAVSKHADLAPTDVFKAHLDGLSATQARKVLGARRFWHRIGLSLLPAESPIAIKAATPTPSSPDASNSLHSSLYSFLGWQLDALQRQSRRSVWSGYERDRTHYPGVALEKKRVTVGRWLTTVAPRWVADLGCNTGEFSLMAASSAEGVIAVDADAESISRLRSRLPPQSNLYTTCTSLDDLDGGRGWMGSEYPGLVQRIHDRAEMVLALALIHHLAIGRSVPLEEVARLMAACTRRYLVVEMIDPADRMLVHLLAQRDRQDADRFSTAAQRSAFAAHFRSLEEVPLEGSSRTLVLMEKLHAD